MESIAGEAKERLLRELRNEEMPEQPRLIPRKTRKYPWDKWDDGKIHTVKRGEDFDTTPQSLVATVHARARYYGTKAQTSVSGDEVTFIIIRPETELAESGTATKGSLHEVTSR